MSISKQTISGWGKFPLMEVEMYEPTIHEIVAMSTRHFDLIPRGLGRSYGDAALAENVLSSVKLQHIRHFDEVSGKMTCESGVSFDHILRTVVPKGWFLPVTPGTKFITVGGAIAHDIHGKNHHCDGSFSQFVEEIEMVLANGDVVKCSRTEKSDLFWATVTGAGLTGFILSATFQLKKIETSYIRQTSYKAKNLIEAFTLFEASEDDWQYSVAWLDCLAKGDDLGRSLLLLGEHLSLEKCNEKAPLALHSDPKLSIPFNLPTFVLNRQSVKTFNTLFYHKQRHDEKTEFLHYDPYFYPLDKINWWNKMYGKRGFVQYQCVFPIEASYFGLTQLLERVQRFGMASFLSVLKKFGKEEDGYLAFPMRGYTLTMDFPMSAELPKFIAELDRVVLDFGGRVYLAKDALLSPSSFRQMYGRYSDWLEVKRRYDPDFRFRSRLAERLGMMM